jgi:hypothetical protein
MVSDQLAHHLLFLPNGTVFISQVFNFLIDIYSGIMKKVVNMYPLIENIIQFIGLKKIDKYFLFSSGLYYRQTKNQEINDSFEWRILWNLPFSAITWMSELNQQSLSCLS